jgi:eukaryotic-like serine/threonine-protein kinase
MNSNTPSPDEIVRAAFEKPTERERSACLDQACAGNEELRRQVEQVLRARPDARDILETPAPENVPTNGGVMTVLTAAVPGLSCIHLRDPDIECLTPVLRVSSDNMPPRSEDRNSRLQVQGEIARGGMGAILKARDADLGRDIAVKVLLEEHKGKPELIQRFVAEAQINGQLQHPGITPVYELGVFSDQRPYFTMKLLKGKTLAALLAARTDPVTDGAKFVSIFSQVCQTLAYAHARGVIHRDLKPANVMVGAFSEVQVMDWGLGKVLGEGGVADEMKSEQRADVSIIRTQRSWKPETSERSGTLTQMGSLLGTPAYMAPEQARGDMELVDQRADVFGLGGILCEILTGQPPFAGKWAEATRKAQTGELTEALARLESCGADPELIGLARRCLAAEPWGRPADAGEVAKAVTLYEHSVAQRLRTAELERAAAEARTVEEAHTRQVAEAKVVEERKRRHATMGLAAAILVLVIAAGSGAAAWIIERRATQHDVETALEEAAKDRESERWPDARAALERAEGRLGTWVLPDLRDRVRRARLDSELVADLDEVRMLESEAITTRSEFERTRANDGYRAAFDKYGLDLAAAWPAEVAPAIVHCPVRTELLTGLYDWLRISPADQRDKLRAVLDLADDDSWRKSFRPAILASEITKLKELASLPEAASQPTTVQFWLADSLRVTGGVREAEILLRKAQSQHPADFWLNYQLGITLLWGDRNAIDRTNDLLPEEAIGYFRAAIAARSTSAAAHNYLGVALQSKHDLEDGIVAWRQAVALNPKLAPAHNNLGFALQLKGDFAGATDEYHKAIAADGNYIQARCNLADLLANFRDPALRDIGQALQHAETAARLDPNNGMVCNALGEVYYRANRWNDAVTTLLKGLPLRKGGSGDDFFFLAMAYERAGNKAEARRWYQKASEWMRTHALDDTILPQYRAEAASVLGLTDAKGNPKSGGR